MSAVELFRFEDVQIRIVVVDDEPWFVAADVCAALSIANPSDAVRRLDQDDLGSTEVVDSAGRRNPNTRIVNESGLYDLVLDSRKPEAKRFRRWVTGVVLPEIRRTGSYSTAPAPRAELSPRELAMLVIAEADRADAAEQKVAELEPAARSWETLTHARGDYLVADAAKILSNDLGISLGQKRLFALLDELRWIYRAGDRRWRAYQSAIEAGRLSEVVREYEHPNDPERLGVSVQVRVTPKGLGVLHTRLADRPPLALVSADS